LRIIEELDYYPNHSGKLLKQGRTYAVAVVSSFFQNVFKMDFVNGIEQAVYHTRYQLRQFTTQTGKEVDKCKEILFGKMADAVFAMNVFPDIPFLEKMKKANKPIVLVEDVVPGFAGVTYDNYQAAYEAVKFLAGRGRRKIAISIGQKSFSGHSFVDNRYKGYLDALKDLDLPYSRVLEIPSYDLETGRQLYSIMKNLDDFPDALFCASGDVTAAGFLQAALSGGLGVPDDIAVMGFDDSIIGQSTTLGLTTMRQPVHEMGQAAFQLALDMLEGQDPGAFSRIVTFPPEIIVRQTV
jgi:LacI family transcriptional regulator